MGYRHHGDRSRALIIKGSEPRIEIGGGLDQIAAGAQVEATAGAWQRWAEGEQRFVSAPVVVVQP